MRIPREKVELVASKDASRERHAISSVNLRIDEKTVGRGKSKKVERKGWLEATDSYRAIRVPVDIDDEDAAGLINPLALATARKNKVEEISANGSVVVPVTGGQLQLDRPVGTYPDLPEILKFEGAPVFSVGINARLLAGLAEALGARNDQGVRLEFFGPTKPVRVTYQSSEIVGVLMPVRLS